ncbi:MAG: FAD-dependent oxidoreductase [Alphaproteobacteria bacterium]
MARSMSSAPADERSRTGSPIAGCAASASPRCGWGGRCLMMAAVRRPVARRARRALQLELVRYLFAWRRHVASRPRPRHAALPRRMRAQPIGDWLAERRLFRMRRFMLRALTVLGYGFLDEVPACQALRWATPSLIASGLFDEIRMPAGGWQSFWARVAKGLNVRVNEPVVEVVREGPGGTLVTPYARCRFEQLLVTIPLDDFARLTPLSPTEQALADAIAWGRYVTTLARVENWFTAHETDAWSAAIEPGAPRGRLLAARRPPPSLRTAAATDGRGELYVCGQYGGEDDFDLARVLRADIAALGGRVTEILQQKVWRYAPRYSADAIRAGLLAEMRRVQGELGTWFSGASFSHEAVSNIANFNALLVRQVVGRLGHC